MKSRTEERKLEIDHDERGMTQEGLVKSEEMDRAGS